MKLRGSIITIVCLATLGCTEDPARSVKVIARPPQKDGVVSSSPSLPVKVEASKPQAVTKVVASPAADVSQPLESCPPLPEGSTGPSELTVSGPCAFEQRAAVSCEASKDDFVVAISRKAKNGATVVLYLNVEHYHGPGSYDGAQMFAAVQGGTTIERWSNDNVQAVVGPDEAFVTLPSTRLDGEPTLVDCSKLIGEATNYQYQCRARGGSAIVVDSAAEILSGKLQCLEHKKE